MNKNEDISTQHSTIKIRLLKSICIVFACLLLVALVIGYNLSTCDIEFHHAEDIFIECFLPPDFTKPQALVTNSDLFAGRILDVTLESGQVDTRKVGTYSLVYSAVFGSVKQNIIQTVHVVDSTPPVITLQIKEDYYVTDFSQYIEEGFIAVDNHDGDISSKVQSVIDGEQVVYSVSDSSGNNTVVVRDIPYKDVEPPVLELLGSAHVYIQQGKEWVDPGYYVSDNYDKDSPVINIDSNLDTSIVGEYLITYKAQDKSGNMTTAQRTVSVIDKNADNMIYLTFDDGPSPYTMDLLNILDKYNVKATFFVVGNEMSDVITEIANRGHVIGAHTYSHEYQIYKNEPTYYQDLNLILNVIYEKTGARPTLIRFPGGSSNTVSKNYCRYIMTQLAESVQRHGYTYFDWSVNSGDADSAKNAEEVTANVINGIKETKRPIVLQHDTKDYSVAATEAIIQWALDHGYVFGVLDSDIVCHHKIAN